MTAAAPSAVLPVRRVRPGPSAVVHLAERIRALQGEDPLAPVTVVVPHAHTGLWLRRRIAREGRFANVRFTVLARLAEMLGAPPLAAASRRPVGAATRDALVREAVRAAAVDVGTAPDHPALVRRLARLCGELRSADDPDGALRDLAAAPGRMARAALAIVEQHERLRGEHRLYDEVALLDAATAALAQRDGAALAVVAETGPVLVHLPVRLAAAQARLLVALAGVTAVEVAVPDAGDGGPGPEMARLLGADWDALPAPATGSAAVRSVHVAADAVEEVRGCVRRILGGLEAQPPVPLHRVAVGLVDEERYRPLLRDALQAAGIPYAVLGGRALSESLAGAGLLSVLRLRDQGFRRVAVLTWLSVLPHAGGGVSVPRWDELSRRAGVVAGVGEWRDLMSALAAECDRRHDEQSARGATTTHLDALRHDADACRRIVARIEGLDSLLVPPAECTWSALSAWAQDILRRQVVDRSWDGPRQEEAQLVAETVRSLANAQDVEPGTDVAHFVTAVEEALTTRRRPEGRLGDGVVVGPPAALLGLEVDAVHVLGLTERAIPSPPPPDPVFAGEDPLGRAPARRRDERLGFDGVLAVAGGGVVHLSVPLIDPDGRSVYASPWLLEEVERLSGRPVDSAAFRQPQTLADLHWLTHTGSVVAAVRDTRVHVDVDERRVAEAVLWHEAGRRLADHPLARRDDLPLARVLEVMRERRSDRLTAFDGNLAAAAGRSALLSEGLAGRPMSPTGMQTWATCPFRDLLDRILRVEATERPEVDVGWSIVPRDRGTLIHAILEEFFTRLAAESRPAAGERYTAADHERLVAIARDHFADAERRRLTGHALVWLNERRAIERDLHTLLHEDEEMRGADFVPRWFERRFGYDDPEWPAVTVALDAGRTATVHGYIDRIDIAGRRGRVIDYKTGSGRNEPDATAENNLAGGRRLQLAVYAAALRAHARATGMALDSVDATYWFITAKSDFALKSTPGADHLDAALSQVLRAVDEGVRGGCFRQAPGAVTERPRRAQSWDECVYCDYDRICPAGRDQVEDRKNTDPVSRLHRLLAGPPDA